LNLCSLAIPLPPPPPPLLPRVAGWRLTRRIGRFLLLWFAGFIVMVLVVGLGNFSPEDTAAHGVD
jgi:hypothetical protein